MTLTLTKIRLVAATGLLLAGAVLGADGTRFSEFTPLPTSAGPTADESRPMTLGNPAFEQPTSGVDRTVQITIPGDDDYGDDDDHGDGK